MSGGVDSSVAAGLLVRQGHEVVGATMQLSPELPPAAVPSYGGCCSVQAVTDARRVADGLGIPHYVLNYRDVFARTVVDPFVGAYAAGRTPNPCLACNRYVKFGALLAQARALDCQYVATGHYARVVPVAGDELGLFRATDPARDQSYALYNLTQAELPRVLFPVGDLAKPEVRRLAGEMGLPVATKPDSQEICFVVEGGYRDFVVDRVPSAGRPGPVVDRTGRVVGTHRGIAGYTVGQRRGLGLAVGEPLYVVAVDAAQNRVVVGSRPEAHSSGLVAGDVTTVSGRPLSAGRRVAAQIRYGGPPVAAEVAAVAADSWTIRFAEPQFAVTPGQAVVLYDGQRVLGGGIIDEARR